ncbi:hypothetical protein IAT38_003085 [Cryptococcus sp. DSM 104549]
MLLYLVRHGKTDLNSTGKVQGSIDQPLSPGGLDQAQRLAEHLRLVPFTEAWTSPLKRAQETAKTILQYQPKAKLHSDERLRARAFGTAEGRVWEEVNGQLEEHDVEGEDELTDRLHSWLSVLIRSHTPSTSTSTTPALSPLSPSSPNSQINPFDLVRALPRPGMPRTPSTPAGGGLGSGVVLVLTHQECLAALVNTLTKEYEEKCGSSGGCEGAGKSPIEVQVPEGVKVEPWMGNTSVAILRVWWEESETGMEARGRLEAWGVEEHLRDEVVLEESEEEVE